MSHLICYHNTFIYFDNLRNFHWIHYISILTTPIKLKTVKVGTITYENPCQCWISPLNKSHKFILIEHMATWDSFDSRFACNHVIYLNLHLIEWKGFSRSWLVKQPDTIQISSLNCNHKDILELNVNTWVRHGLRFDPKLHFPPFYLHENI